MKKTLLIILFLLLLSLPQSNVLAKEEETFNYEEKTGVYAISDEYMIYSGEMLTALSSDDVFYNIILNYNFSNLKIDRTTDKEEILKLTKLDKDKLKRISLLMYYGYKYQDEEYNHQDVKWYAITQIMIYETVKENVKWHFTLGKYGEVKDDLYLDEINEIENLIKEYDKEPSFTNEIYKTPVNKEIIIQDDNKVLSKYNSIKYSDKINITKEDNILKITPNSKTKEEVILEYSTDLEDIGLYNKYSWSIISRGNIDTKTSSFTIDATKKKVIIKTLCDDIDASFNDVNIDIYNEQGSLVKNVNLDENGYIEFDLEYGSYYIPKVNSSKNYDFTLEKSNFIVNEDDIEDVIIILNATKIKNSNQEKIDDKSTKNNIENPKTMDNIGLYLILLSISIIIFYIAINLIYTFIPSKVSND